MVQEVIYIVDAAGNKKTYQVDVSNGLNIKDIGAIGNGIVDDLPVIREAVKYVTSATALTRKILIPNGVFRITDEIIIGGKACDVSDLFIEDPINKGASANFNEYLKGVRTVQIKVTGDTGSCIYADFNDTSKLKAVLFLGGMYGDRRAAASVEQFNIEVTNLGIYAQGYFINGKRNVSADYSANNVCAIASMYTQGLKLSELTIYGFKEGQVHNNSYFIDENNVSSYYCGRVSLDVQSHCGTYSNITNFYCRKGNEIRSNQVIVNNLYSGHCGIGLHVAGGNNILNSIYLETQGATEAQLIIGDNPTDPLVEKYLLYGIIFNVLTICCPDKNAISFKNNVRRVFINGGEMQSVVFAYKSADTKVIVQNILGTLPPAITLKPVYGDSTGKQVN